MTTDWPSGESEAAFTTPFCGGTNKGDIWLVSRFHWVTPSGPSVKIKRPERSSPVWGIWVTQVDCGTAVGVVESKTRGVGMWVGVDGMAQDARVRPANAPIM